MAYPIHSCEVAVRHVVDLIEESVFFWFVYLVGHFHLQVEVDVRRLEFVGIDIACLTASISRNRP